MRWSAIIAVLWILTLSAPTFAQQSAPASAYAPIRCANPVAPTPSDAIDRAVVAWMLRSRTPGVSLAIVNASSLIVVPTDMNNVKDVRRDAARRTASHL